MNKEYSVIEEYKVNSDEIKFIFREISGLKKIINNDDKVERMSINEIELYKKYFEKETNEFRNICMLSQTLTNLNFTFILSIHQVYKKFYEKEYSNSVIRVEIMFKEVSLNYIVIKNFEELSLCIDNLYDFKNIIINRNTLHYKTYLKKPLVFTQQAASIFSHEIFGHMFEIDNFYYYKYERYLLNLEKFKVDIIDNPLMENTNGYYKYDDASIQAKKTIIFKDGYYTGNLIGGVYGSNIVNSSLRRENLLNKLLPRMSNLIIKSKNEISYPYTYIEIIKLGKCYVDHNSGQIIFDINSAFLVQNSEYIAVIEPFKIILKFDFIFEHIQSSNIIKNHFTPIQCRKHNQIINCSSMSNDWLYIP